jgi:hypothetical protein
VTAAPYIAFRSGPLWVPNAPAITTLGTNESLNMNTHGHGILTATEVAAELRCSKAQVYRLMKGAIPGVKPLRTLPLGRKKVVQRSSFEAWKGANEENRVIVGSDSGESAVDALPNRKK